MIIFIIDNIHHHQMIMMINFYFFFVAITITLDTLYLHQQQQNDHQMFLNLVIFICIKKNPIATKYIENILSKIDKMILAIHRNHY